MSTARPTILIVADRKALSSAAWPDVPTDGLPHSYISAVENAGGLPLLVPSTTTQLDNIDALLAIADGILLAGGRDLDSEMYGQRAHEANDEPLRIRDELEVALSQGAFALGIPVLGSCRGMQVLNVAFGGTLIQHLNDRLDMTPHRKQVGVFTSHTVEVAPGTRLAGLVQTFSVEIASHHHQAVDVLGSDFLASAHAPDGTVEAIEMPGDCFTMGVQWHPEESPGIDGSQIVTGLISAASSYRNSLHRGVFQSIHTVRAQKETTLHG